MYTFTFLMIYHNAEYSREWTTIIAKNYHHAVVKLKQEQTVPFTIVKHFQEEIKS